MAEDEFKTSFTPQDWKRLARLSQGMTVMRLAVRQVFVILFLALGITAISGVWTLFQLSRHAWSLENFGNAYARTFPSNYVLNTFCAGLVFSFIAGMILFFAAWYLWLSTPKKLGINATPLLGFQAGAILAWLGGSVGYILSAVEPAVSAAETGTGISSKESLFEELFPLLFPEASSMFGGNAPLFLGVLCASAVVFGSLFLMRLSRFFPAPHVKTRIKIASDFLIGGFFFLYVLPQVSVFSVTLPWVCISAELVLFGGAFFLLHGIFGTFEREIQKVLNENHSGFAVSEALHTVRCGMQFWGALWPVLLLGMFTIGTQPPVLPACIGVLCIAFFIPAMGFSLVFPRTLLGISPQKLILYPLGVMLMVWVPVTACPSFFFSNTTMALFYCVTILFPCLCAFEFNCRLIRSCTDSRGLRKGIHADLFLFLMGSAYCFSVPCMCDIVPGVFLLFIWFLVHCSIHLKIVSEMLSKEEKLHKEIPSPSEEQRQNTNVSVK